MVSGENGVELIVHHCDSINQPGSHMIEMGIDIWQGCLSTNNNPELIKIWWQDFLHGDIDNGLVDRGLDPEIIAKEVERACRSCGKLYFIPSTTMG